MNFHDICDWEIGRLRTRVSFPVFTETKKSGNFRAFFKNEKPFFGCLNRFFGFEFLPAMSNYASLLSRNNSNACNMSTRLRFNVPFRLYIPLGTRPAAQYRVSGNDVTLVPMRS